MEASLRADAWALQQLGAYQQGKLIAYAWVSRGLTSIEDFASWHFDGNVESAKQALARTKDAMRALLALEELPSVESAKTLESVNLAEQSVLEGELVSQWAIQADGDGSQPVPLPMWFKPAIDRTIMIWTKEASKWDECLAKRHKNGREHFTPKQQEQYDTWKGTWCRRVILDKKRQIQVLNFHKKNLTQLRSSCLLLEVQLAREAENLKIRSGTGIFYRLKLLEVKVPAAELPAELDHFPEDALSDCTSPGQFQHQLSSLFLFPDHILLRIPWTCIYIYIYYI